MSDYFSIDDLIKEIFEIKEPLQTNKCLKKKFITGNEGAIIQFKK